MELTTTGRQTDVAFLCRNCLVHNVASKDAACRLCSPQTAPEPVFWDEARILAIIIYAAVFGLCIIAVSALGGK